MDVELDFHISEPHEPVDLEETYTEEELADMKAQLRLLNEGIKTTNRKLKKAHMAATRSIAYEYQGEK